MKKRIFSVILAVCMILGATIPAFAASKSVLKFDENGEFKILHLCDGQDGYPAQERMMIYINYMLKVYDPDLVVLGGDNTVAPKENKEDAIKELVTPFVENKVYFTLVFGNHDDEQGVDKDTLLKYYQKYGGKYCLAYDADPTLHGTAIHNLPILSSNGKKIKFNLWMFDTGTYVYDEDGNRLGYDSVTPDQIEWYKKTSEAVEKEAGEKINSLAFQHMVPPDVYDVMFPDVPFELSPLTEKYNGKNYPIVCPDTSVFDGHLLEPPSPGVYNYGQFDAMAENGDVLAVFAGHDHINSYEVEHKDIMIINTPGMAFRAYGNEFVRGGRLITVNEDNTSKFKSEVITVNDLALKNADFAEDMAINRLDAGFWVILGKILLVLSEISGIGAVFLYW
ncbi:MAG: metallophosphoesterase [Clostridia bacterium]|nr:metallophosphoesterase [Clostridia bacterium]